ncbi:MAG: hypothetical protein IJY79_06395 [Clostridia bacterium]|nr:hypothetical protein [Clostridia bacterium]
MKKYVSLILVFILLVGLIACRKDDTVTSSSLNRQETVESPEQSDSTPETSQIGDTPQTEESSKTETPQKTKSTITTPYEVRFYKNGMQTISTDKELNLRIARHIEAWFDGQDTIAATNLAATTDLIREIKLSEWAIELNFDSEINDKNAVFGKNTRTLFLPITGEYDYLIFNNSITSPDYWGGPKGAGDGLEKFFEEVTFIPLTEEEMRWRSTVSTPSTVKFYSSGKLIGESRDMKGYAFNREIALKIESWFYKKDDIQTKTVSEIPLETAWGSDDYIELSFFDAPTFYGEQIIDEKYSNLIIPLTGDYAYHIFVGTYNETSDVAIDIGGSGLEPLFEKFIIGISLS